MPRKRLLNYRGKALFPELFIARLFAHSGWTSAWYSAFYRKFIVDWHPRRYLSSQGRPRAFDALLGELTVGCWDVVSWKPNGQILFAEAKRKGHDRLRPTQRRWLDRAMQMGLKEENFLVVEWTLRD